MSAVVRPRVRDVALLGVGTVGTAFYEKLRRLGDPRLRLAYVASSRHAVRPGLELPERAVIRRRDAAHPIEHAIAPGTLVVDATASADVARRHVEWLAAGCTVVTANKLATSGPLLEWRRILDASDRHARYGDAATVGAGLPFLRTIRALRAGGDRIRSVVGVLSGSLAWLLDDYDGRAPFAQRVDEARRLGYTEPDPDVDLSGEDVRRKLVILARAAGHAIEPHEVEVESLARRDDLADLARDAKARGRKLAYVGRIDGNGVCATLEALEPEHPLAQGRGPDNRLVIASDRYAERPLVIQGPGAGAGVTAGALLEDVLRLA